MNTNEMIALDEGFSSKPYLDHLGYPTIGYGLKIGPKGAPLEHYCFTVSHDTAMSALEQHVGMTVHSMEQHDLICSAASKCADCEARAAVLISMAYQMGVEGLLGFKKTLQYISDGDFLAASLEMLDSKWAKQTPERAQRMSKQMADGQWHGYYFGE